MAESTTLAEYLWPLSAGARCFCCDGTLLPVRVEAQTSVLMCPACGATVWSDEPGSSGTGAPEHTLACAA